MKEKTIKKSIFARLRNNFIAGVVVLIPIGITLYLTLFIIKFSGKIVPKGINPNNYLPFDIPGLEILIAVIIITFIGWLSLSFLGKKFFELFNNLLKKIPILRTIYSAFFYREAIANVSAGAIPVHLSRSQSRSTVITRQSSGICHKQG